LYLRDNSVLVMTSIRWLRTHKVLFFVVAGGRWVPKTDPLLLQQDKELLSLQLSTNDILLQPDANGRTHSVLTNFSGFTQCLKQGDILGQVVQVQVVEAPSETTESLSRAFNVTTSIRPQSQKETQRKEKLREVLIEPDLPDNEKCALLDFLVAHHDAFSLEEGERGETDLIEMEIDTGDAAPKRQSPRRMPFAVRQEVAEQLDQMQINGVIKPSRSPWASPVFLVRKRDGTHRFCVDYQA
jgi:hypothetical protein